MSVAYLDDDQAVLSYSQLLMLYRKISLSLSFFSLFFSKHLQDSSYPKGTKGNVRVQVTLLTFPFGNSNDALLLLHFLSYEPKTCLVAFFLFLSSFCLLFLRVNNTRRSHVRAHTCAQVHSLCTASDLGSPRGERGRKRGGGGRERGRRSMI